MTGNWREQQKALLKQKLYDTALSLFREQGYDATTVKQITERAQVSKGVFFNYYPSKDDLLVQWYGSLYTKALDTCKNRQFDSARDAILCLIKASIEQAELDVDLINAKSRISHSDHKIVTEERDQDQHLIQFYHKYLQQDQANGLIAKDVDLHFVADLILTIETGTARRWIYSHNSFPLYEAIQKNVGFIFDSLQKEAQSCG